VAKYFTNHLNYLQLNWVNISKWLATGLFMFSGGVLAANIEISRWGFVTFFLAHILLVVVFYRVKDYAMMMQNGFFIFIDLLGIFRWFIK
jgi:hypothetical protein